MTARESVEHLILEIASKISWDLLGIYGQAIRVEPDGNIEAEFASKLEHALNTEFWLQLCSNPRMAHPKFRLVVIRDGQFGLTGSIRVGVEWVK